MFANEDFDLDEDFLNDVLLKESQTLSSNEESPTKRFKEDEGLMKLIHAKSQEHFLVQNTNDIEGDKTTCRTNLILQRLKRNENTVADPSIHQRVPKIDSQSSNPGKSSSAQDRFLHPTNDKCRKTLILEVLQKNSVKNKSTRLCSPEKKCELTDLNVTLKNSKLEHCETAGKDQLKRATTYIKPVTLVRQFPGPAGLLPHLSSEIIPPLNSESSCFDNSNDDTNTDNIDNTSIISKYCSQDTTISFSGGPWQTLISDLTPDFLNGHEISTVKQKVLSNLYSDNKVPFIAGIVQRVDFSCLDPLVVLKDCTGTIEGTICKDILVEYPHALDIGVVLFLGNVGLLTIGSYLKKCHIIVGLKNIINVYTGKSKIFSISEMDARLQKLKNCNYPCESVANRVSSSSCSSNSKFDCGPNTGRVRATENTDRRLHLGHLKGSDNLGSSSNYTSRPIVAEESSAITTKHVIPELSKTFIHKSTNVEKNHKDSNSFQGITNSLQHTDHMNNKSTFESVDLEDFDDEFTASFLDIDDNLLSKAVQNINANTNSGIETNSSKSMNEVTAFKRNPPLNATPLNAKLSQETKHFISKVSNICNKGTKNSEATDTKIIAASVAKEKSNLPRTSDIKIKLSVFRSNTELTQPPSQDLSVTSTGEVHKQNNKCVESSATSDLLLNGENDSDEELFSQLDVDAIFSHYNKLNDVN